MLSPLYAYLIPLLAVAFLLALVLKEIPLRTRARRDAAQAALRAAASAPPGRRSYQPRQVPPAGPAASQGHTHRAPPPLSASPLE
jgi:hypothetical protein